MSDRPTSQAPFVTALHVRELARLPDPLAALRGLRSDGLAWWLDSALPGPGRARFSFVGSDPYAVVRARGNQVELLGRRAVRPDLPLGTLTRVGDPFETLRRLLPPAPVRQDGAARCPVPFVGGAVGCFGYELGERTESLALQAEDDLGMPDLSLLLVDRLLAIDHVEGRAWGIGLGFDVDPPAAAARAETACAGLVARVGDAPDCVPARAPERPAAAAAQGSAPPGLRAHFDAARHAGAVAEIQSEIARGNVYQVNLCHRMDLPLPAADPLALYQVLRALNPAPFAAYLELPDASVLSSSPERFLRVDGEGRAESRPIKGTRPRSVGCEDDRALARELRESEKDRAENLMIVDLVRNDLGRVCRLGSVAVPELMAIESYATVHQMVSTVSGVLRDDRDGLDLLRASFPPGSMTGAPKRAAMQVIDRLEPVRRGIYSGGLGYLDVRGGLDLAVVIRTLIVADGWARLHVGGGVVADSRPAAEWQESLDKARALLEALSRVQGEVPDAGAASAVR